MENRSFSTRASSRALHVLTKGIGGGGMLGQPGADKDNRRRKGSSNRVLREGSKSSNVRHGLELTTWHWSLFCGSSHIGLDQHLGPADPVPFQYLFLRRLFLRETGNMEEQMASAPPSISLDPLHPALVGTKSAHRNRSPKFELLPQAPNSR
jgi:hypothetical protein